MRSVLLWGVGIVMVVMVVGVICRSELDPRGWTTCQVVLDGHVPGAEEPPAEAEERQDES